MVTHSPHSFYILQYLEGEKLLLENFLFQVDK